jgi:S1-C subfamily serine protease
MNLLDVIIVLAAVAFGIGGFRNGAIVGLCSMVGFFGGAALGAQLAEPIGSRLADGRGQIPVAIVCVLFFAMIGQLLGVYVAAVIKRRVVGARAASWDHGIGSGLGVLSVLLVAWMVAVPLASSPYPQLAAQASHSRIVRAVNDAMPHSVRSLYSSLRTFLDQSGFPPVLGDLPSTSVVNVAPPDKTLSTQLRTVVLRSEESVFKVYGEAPSCGRAIEGSSFVYAPHRLITNAHVVAGTDAVSVQVGGESLPARVVLFDPRRDVAVLDVPALPARALTLSTVPATTGESAAVVGFPEDGGYTARSARVRSRGDITGNDIYGHSHVRREIYSIRGIVRSGNSGGPLLAPDGQVLGVVFATALDSSDTGFVLTSAEVSSDAAAGRTATAAVPTGSCTPE